MKSNILKVCLLACAFVTFSSKHNSKSNNSSVHSKTAAVNKAKNPLTGSHVDPKVPANQAQANNTKSNNLAQNTESFEDDLQSTWLKIKVKIKEHKFPKLNKQGLATSQRVKKFLEDTYVGQKQEAAQETVGRLMVFDEEDLKNKLPVGDYILDTDGGLIPLRNKRPFELKSRVVVSMYPTKSYLFKNDVIYNSSGRTISASPNNALLLREYQS